MNKKSIIIALVIVATFLATYWRLAKAPTSESKIPSQFDKTSEMELTESEAKAIAEKFCIKGGESLAPGYYNENSKTWWFDANLNSTQKSCNPACVVSEATKTAEINWRCTGLIIPK